LTQLLSYFPSEYRFLNVLFSAHLLQPNLTFSQRFLLYQVHHIKEIRQIASSTEINQKMFELKAIAKQCISMTRKFWANPSVDLGYFYQVEKMSKHIKTAYEECSEKWPNNLLISESYSYFLIEGATDFSLGVKIKFRSCLIEEGMNFTRDLSFESLMRTFPRYIKKQIIDSQGNFLTSKIHHQYEVSSNNQESQNQSIFTNDLPPESEDRIGKYCFNQHRLRLAYQRALQYQHFNSLFYFRYGLFASFLLGIAIVLFISIYVSVIFSNRALVLGGFIPLEDFIVGFVDAANMIMIQQLHSTLRIDEDVFTQIQKPVAFISSTVANFSGDFSDESDRWTLSSIAAINRLLNHISSQAENGVNISQEYPYFVQLISPIIYCTNGQPLYDSVVNVSMYGLAIYSLIRLRFLLHENETNVTGKKEFCQAVLGFQQFDLTGSGMMTSFSSNEHNKYLIARKSCLIISISCMVLYFSICFPYLLVFSILSFKELNNLLKIMQDIEPSSRNKAASSLSQYSKDIISSDEIGAFSSKYSLKLSLVIFLFSFLLLLSILFIFIVFIFSYFQNNKIQEILILVLQEGRRLGQALISFYDSTLYLAKFHDFLSDDFINETYFENHMKFLSQRLQETNFVLLGLSDSPSLMGIDSELDQLNFYNICDSFVPLAKTFSDSYFCAGLIKTYDKVYALFQQILHDPLNENFSASSAWLSLHQILNKQIRAPQEKSSQILRNHFLSSIDDFDTVIVIIDIVGIAVLIAAFGFIFYYTGFIHYYFDGALLLLRRIPPLSIIQNLPLFQYLSRQRNKSSHNGHAFTSVIEKSQDSIICINRNETIEIVNQSVSELFGYSPSQLLGNHLSCILPQETCSDIFSHISLMREGQCALLYEDHIEGLTDLETYIPVHATLIGFADHSSTFAQSFVVILRDESQLNFQIQQAKEAKRKTEELLYSILPRDIVIRINKGEKNISFSVPSASVIFIDIVKFSEYSSLLSPGQIMKSLSTIYAKFDSLCETFEMITKIKLIGDIYMAAGGLFHSDQSPSSHASQLVNFGLSCINALEELNTQLDAHLQVRVGVNTDGPLIAGVLGTDKPVFDIIGDPINVAARLQSTDIPGHVQISENVYRLIKNMEFDIQPRGEISLKGKGMRRTYVVKPKHNSSPQINNDMF
jgi:class 3 adenylate cyclase/PAS domain-containing protein